MSGTPSTIAGFPGAAAFPAMHLDPADYDALIVEYGALCEIRRGMLCPCRRIEDHSPRGTCPHCKGVGQLYPKALRVCTAVLIEDPSDRPGRQPAGEITAGTRRITFCSGFVPGEGDLLLPMGEEHVVQEILTHAEQPVDNRASWARTEHPDQRPPKLDPLTDRLLYPDALCVELLTWIGASGALVQGAEGSHFRRDGDRIVWLESLGPRPGETYTVRYRAPGAYVLQNAAPIAHTDGGVPLNYQATAQRLDKRAEPDRRSDLPPPRGGAPI